jgi:hypothetical protein
LLGGVGATGLQGPIGAAGINGSTGLQGPIGAAGINGSTGLQGPIGLTGGQGIQGLKGDSGAAGINGATGANGSFVYSGQAGCAASNLNGVWRMQWQTINRTLSGVQNAPFMGSLTFYMNYLGTVTYSYGELKTGLIESVLLDTPITITINDYPALPDGTIHLCQFVIQTNVGRAVGYTDLAKTAMSGDWISDTFANNTTSTGYFSAIKLVEYLSQY